VTKGLSIHRLAEYELRDAEEYYRSIDPDLGAAVFDKFEAAVELIKEIPLAWPLVNQKARCKRLTRFPYEIFFVVADETVRILAISHQYRRPFHWIDRT
jgi:hypothetical protein